MKIANIINSQPLNVFLTFSEKGVNLSPLMACPELCGLNSDHLWPRLVYVTENHKIFVACHNTCFAQTAGIIWGLAWQLCWIWQADVHNLLRARFRTDSRSLLLHAIDNKVQANPHWRWELQSTLALGLATTPHSQGKGNECKDRQSKRTFWWLNMISPKIYSWGIKGCIF